MAHPMVEQLRFTRAEWLRGLDGVAEGDALKHFGPMNCISWIVGHLAWQEQAYWLIRAQERVLFPDLNRKFASGARMSTPALYETLEPWKTVVEATDPYLDALTTEDLQEPLLLRGQSIGQSIGSGMQRMIYHYWYHLGEILAIRQQLGESDLPQFVGAIEELAPYRPEAKI